MTTDTFINLIIALYVLMLITFVTLGISLLHKIASEIKERQLSPNKKRKENVKPAFKRK